MNETQLKEFLIGRVKFHWDSANNMLFLADIPTELREHKKLNYRDILGEKRLKAFAAETEGKDSYRLVQHPSQKAKLGLVPYEAEFEFSDNEDNDIAQKRKEHFPHNVRQTTLEFLTIVNSLPETDQEEITIPTKIIAKLLSDK